MLLCTIVYVLAWRHGNKVGVRREQERIDALKANGYLQEKQQQHEDGLDKDGRELGL